MFSKVTAEFEVVTPMFIGDGNQLPDSVRPTAIKGALRFWWRASIWSQILAEHNNNEAKALNALHQQECELFGSAYDSKQPETGPGQIKVKLKPPAKIELLETTKFKEAGINYLLGQGLNHHKDGLFRKAIAPVSANNFKLDILISNKTDKQKCKQIVDTVKLFGLLGGLGARQRKGFGSVSLKSLSFKNNLNDNDSIKLPTNIETYIKEIKGFFQASWLHALPPFSAFSSHTLCDISCSGNSYEQVLNKIGTTQQIYRSYGKDGIVNHKTALRIFKADHDALYSLGNNKRFTHHPERRVFGMPHNYYLSKAKVQIIGVQPSEEKKTRRASPLFIHIHKIGDSYYGVQTLLCAEFLEKKNNINYINIKNKEVIKEEPPGTVDYNIIKDYMMLPSYSGNGTTSSGFNNRIEVFKGASL